MEELRNRIDVKLVNNGKDYLNCKSNSSDMLHKIFDNNLVPIRKSKLALKLNKPAYFWMWILDLSKVWMCNFHYDYIKNKYDSKPKPLFTDTEKKSMKILTAIKKFLTLVIIRLSQNTMITQTNLVI